MSKKTRSWAEAATETASAAVKRARRLAGSLPEAPLGLDIVARQYLATNYKVNDKHNGVPSAMYDKFKARLVDAVGEGFDMGDYQGFADAEQFAEAHWRATGFSRADNTRGTYAADIWLRDRGNGRGVREGPVLAALRQALLDNPAAPSLFKPETIPAEKVDLLEYLHETRASATEPPAAQDDDGAKWRKVVRMFNGLKRSDDPAVVLEPLVLLWDLVSIEEEEEEAAGSTRRAHHPSSTPMLRASPRVTRSQLEGGGTEMHYIKRAAAAQICIELCGSLQKTACMLVLCHIFWFLCAPKLKYVSALSSISNYTDQRVQARTFSHPRFHARAPWHVGT